MSANQASSKSHVEIGEHPGVFLEKTLEAQGLSQSDLSKRTGLTTKTINTIIKGGTSISPETALLLEVVLGVPAKDWLSREINYQINRVNQTNNEILKEDLQLLKDIDLKPIFKRKWISKCKNDTDQLRELLTFFGVSSAKQLPTVWHQLAVNYRTSKVYKKSHYNIMLWLRRGEKLAKEIECEPYNSKKFKKILSECRKLTTNPFEDIYKKIESLCKSAGVAVVFVPELKNISTSGAAHWINKDKALIQLSLRGKKDDLFWFSFFHEAAHILLHGRKDQFLDNNKSAVFHTPERELIEAEADEFAANFLISKKDFSNFTEKGEFCEESIKSFSKMVGIAPGIVVGKLQKYELVSWATSLNSLKQTYVFPPELDH